MPFKDIEGTRFIISGRRQLDLSDHKNLELIRGRNVKQIYLIFLGETMESGLSHHQKEVEQALVRQGAFTEHGIHVIPLPKEPNNIGPFEVFSKNVEKLKGNEKALVMCYNGLHNSGAYVAYHLLKEGNGFGRVHELFRRAGWSDGSISTIKQIIGSAGINVNKFSEQWVQIAMKRKRLAGAHQNVQEKPGINKFKEFLKRMGQQNRQEQYKRKL